MTAFPELPAVDSRALLLLGHFVPVCICVLLLVTKTATPLLCLVCHKKTSLYKCLYFLVMTFCILTESEYWRDRQTKNTDFTEVKTMSEHCFTNRKALSADLGYGLKAYLVGFYFHNFTHSFIH